MEIRYLLTQIIALWVTRLSELKKKYLYNRGDPIRNFCCFGFVLRKDEGHKRFTVRSVQLGKGFLGFLHCEDSSIDTKSVDCADSTFLTLNEISEWKLHIARLYGTQRREYESLWRFVFDEITFSIWRADRLEKKQQIKFEENFRFSTDRFTVLKAIVDWKFYKENKSNVAINYKFNKLELFTEIHSKHIWGLQESHRYSELFSLLIDSLVSSGDLNEHPVGVFILTGQALQSLSDYEKASQRERLSDRTNNSIKWSNIIIALATVLSVIMALFDNFKDFILK